MTPQKIAEFVISTFDANKTLTVEQAIIRSLLLRGMSEAEAIDLTPANVVSAVRRCLQASQQDDKKYIPFYFSENNPDKLVGKARRRSSDNVATSRIRQVLHLEDNLLSRIYEMGDCQFEKVSAKLLVLAGAGNAQAGCTKDDGGIDVWARVPLLDKRPDVLGELLPVNILDTPLLVLAQCKCYNPSKQHGPDEIRSFNTAVISCIDKYAANTCPPANRVPDDYYRRGETVLKMFFTTASFSDKAAALAKSLDIHIVDGVRVARYLLLNNVGINQSGSTSFADPSLIVSWLSSH